MKLLPTEERTQMFISKMFISKMFISKMIIFTSVYIYVFILAILYFISN